MTNGSFRLVRPFLGMIMIGFVAAGCSDDDDDNIVLGDPTLGSMQVFATDVPPELDRLRSVEVTIQRVEAVAAVGTGQAANTAVLYDAALVGPQTIDLLPLRAGARALIASGLVEPGIYEQVRVFFSDVAINYETPGGIERFTTDNGTLIYGGEQEQGVDFVAFDLPDPGVIVNAGENEDVLLDFDLFQSLDVQGDASDPTTITFTPSGQARVIEPTSGAIFGVVRTDADTPAQPGDDTPVNNAIVTLTQGEDVVGATKSDAGGVFLIEGLDAGTYQLLVTDPEDAQRQFQSIVSVNSSQTTTTDPLLSSTAPVGTN